MYTMFKTQFNSFHDADLEESKKKPKTKNQKKKRHNSIQKMI